MIWDINARKGYWQTVGSIIKQLDTESPGWRKQKRVSITFPLSNSTDDNGLRKLQREIGESLYTLIANGRDVEVHLSVSIPVTDETSDERIELEKFVREGTPLTLKGEHIQEFTLPEWWTEWFSDPEMRLERLEIVPRPSEHVEPVTMVLSNELGQVSLQDIELKRIQTGYELVVLSNEHQNAPITFTLRVPLVINGPTPEALRFTVNHLGYNALEARDILRFLQNLCHGGKLSVLFKKHKGLPLSVGLIPSDLTDFHQLVCDSRRLELVDNLCFIQEKTHHMFQVPADYISAENFDAAIELKEIFDTGRTVRTKTSIAYDVTSLDTCRNLLELFSANESDTRYTIQQDFEESFVELFGTQFQCGSVKKTVSGKLAFGLEELSEYVITGKADQPFLLRLTDVEIVEEFPKWQK